VVTRSSWFETGRRAALRHAVRITRSVASLRCAQRPGQVRFITRPKSRTMRAASHHQVEGSLGHLQGIVLLENLATLEYSKCYSRANHKHRSLRGPRRLSLSFSLSESDVPQAADLQVNYY
jgi:hypothetical protein